MQTVADVYDSEPKMKNQLPRDFGRGLSFLKKTNLKSLREVLEMFHN